MYIEEYNRLHREKATWQTEEEVRLGWLYAIRDSLGIVFHAERGRSDADYNQVIIEFKNKGFFHNNPNSPKFKEAMEELSRYIPAKAAHEGIDKCHYTGIAIDGESIAFARIIDSGDIVHGPIMPISVSSVSMVFELCKESCRRGLTAENLIEDFGHDSLAGRQLMQTLADALLQFLSQTENNKIKMLYMEWKSLYGQVADLSSSQLELIERAIGFTYPHDREDRLSNILFVIHTFDSIIIKLLAAEIVSQLTELTAYEGFSQNIVMYANDHFVEALDQDVEHSQLYSRAHIHGFVEEPLFSWYLDAYRNDPHSELSDRIVTALKEVIVKLSAYLMNDLSYAKANDVLKRFYQNIVPQTLRKSLGEFYTPDWLVEVVLDKVQGHFEKLRFLDPTCGSGSFLLAIIKRIRDNVKCDPAELLQIITNNVWGFDLNPLAVQTARVNYLIAISDLIVNAPGIDIEIPILLADAIYSPAPDPDGNGEVVNYVIGSDIANLTISLPIDLALNRVRLEEVFKEMNNCVESDKDATYMIYSLVHKHILSSSESDKWGALLSATYNRVLSLHRRNWNGIWLRIVRNYFWSSTAGEFDVIVGNPPWVRWSKLPELYRNRVMPTCRHYDIFSKTPFYGGNELDISGLITYTVSDKWLKKEGTLIFLLTQTHFQSASSAGFRRFHIRNDMYLKPEEVEDLKNLRAFPDAANKTAIFVAKKTVTGPDYPVTYHVWNSAAGHTRIIPENATKQTVLDRTVRVLNEATPVQGNDSPWAILPPGEFQICAKMAGRCDWIEGRKGVTCDLNGIYFVNIVNIAHNGKLVQIETRPEAGRTNIGPKQRFWVEPSLLYPVVKGASDLSSCLYKPEHQLYAIIPNRGIAGNSLTRAKEDVEIQNPELYKYFETFEEILKRRSTYRTRMKTAPFYAVYNVGEYTFAPWKVIWPEQPGNNGLPVAVIHTADREGIGEKVIVPDHKIYFCEFEEPTTAYYLCGLLSCEYVQKFIQSFSIMIQVGDIFKHLNLPEFDKENKDHCLLAEITKRAHQENELNRGVLLSQISNVGNRIVENWNPEDK